jgi:hypothetical protein
MTADDRNRVGRARELARRRGLLLSKHRNADVATLCDAHGHVLLVGALSEVEAYLAEHTSRRRPGRPPQQLPRPRQARGVR